MYQKRGTLPGALYSNYWQIMSNFVKKSAGFAIIINIQIKIQYNVFIKHLRRYGMGYIRNDIKTLFLSTYVDQQEMLKPFLNGFNVTYAEKCEINNTTLFAYMLKPEEFIKEAFGIEREILLAYSPYDELQPRAFQALDFLFNKFPMKNRVDTLNCFFVSRDSEITKYSGINSSINDQLRSIVPFVYSELIQNSNDSWYVRNVLKKNFFDIDLFGYTLPLKNDSSFFGRQQIIGRYIDSIKRCENRGIFG